MTKNEIVLHPMHGAGMKETQDHLEICDGYGKLREGKDLFDSKDKIKYFQEVIKEREEMVKKFRKTKLRK